jgi:hypothetical protein
MDDASQRIAEKLAARLLPGTEAGATWEGFGLGLHCDGCDRPILPSERQLEPVLPDGRTLRFHAPCAAIWQRFKRVLPLLRRERPPGRMRH